MGDNKLCPFCERNPVVIFPDILACKNKRCPIYGRWVDIKKWNTVRPKQEFQNCKELEKKGQAWVNFAQQETNKYIELKDKIEKSKEEIKYEIAIGLNDNYLDGLYKALKILEGK